MTTPAEALSVAAQYFERGLLHESELICNRIVEVEPAQAGGWTLLGLIAVKRGDFPRALECSRRAVQHEALLPDAHHGLGLALRGLGRLEEAVTALRTAVAIRPDFSAAHDSLAGALKQQGRLTEAIASYRRALEIDPDSPETLTNLGIALVGEDVDEAVACCRRAAELGPQLPQTHSNLGFVLPMAGKLDEAIAACKRALELSPHYAEAYCNLGAAYHGQGVLDEAAACFERSLAINPQLAPARANRSMLLLLQGDFEQGWPEYEWRWKTERFPPRPFTAPQWSGEALVGRSILLHAEQGFGDTFQFVRYAPLLKLQGATVILECQKSLEKLLAGCVGIDRLIAQGDDLPAVDFHSPLLSLPAVFRTTLDTVPEAAPYLLANPTLVAQWRDKLKPIRGFRIGINWKGRSGKGMWQQRDIPLGLLRGLAQIPDVRLISLQRGEARQEVIALGDKSLVVDPGDDVDSVQGAFMDTAAIMMNLDLVISSDTSIPHLAGALGVPVWLALPLASEWRWLLARDDSPWYPTMRLFRQKAAGDWAGVVEEVRAALETRLRSSMGLDY